MQGGLVLFVLALSALAVNAKEVRGLLLFSEENLQPLKTLTLLFWP